MEVFHRHGLPESIQSQIRSLVHTLNELQRDRLHETDLTLAQIHAVVAIGKHADQSIGAIGKVLGIGLPSASLLIDRLVKAGYVERHQSDEDRRIWHCRLTESGKEIYHVITFGERRLRTWLERMQEDDLAALHRGLSALGDAAQDSLSRVEERK